MVRLWGVALWLIRAMVQLVVLSFQLTVFSWWEEKSPTEVGAIWGGYGWFVLMNEKIASPQAAGWMVFWIGVEFMVGCGVISSSWC